MVGPRSRATRWRTIVHAALCAAHAVVRRLAPPAGQRVVAGRADGYRPWDPEVIAVDTATERAVRRVLARAGVCGTLLSEEAGEVPLGGRARATEPVYVVMDPFDGSLLYRRGIRAHWFTALGIYSQGPPRDGAPRAAGVIDHVTGEVVLADAAGAVRLLRAGARAIPLQPATTLTMGGAFVETYLMKPEVLYPVATALRPLFERARLVFPNGGPGGFADVAAGRIDVYLGWQESLTEVFSACYLAERAGAVVTDWRGAPLAFRPDVHASYTLVCSANRHLHREVLSTLAGIAPPKGLPV